MASQRVRDYEATGGAGFSDCAFGTVRTVLIVEDHGLVREGISRLVSDVLREECGMVQILEAATLREACQKVASLRDGLDLVLLDLELPDSHTAESIACIKREWAGVPVAVISATEDWSLGVVLMKLGALGLLPKKSSVSILSSALKLIFAGGRFFPDEVFRLLAADAGHGLGPEADSPGAAGSQAGGAAGGGTEGLPPRQREVLSLMLDGLSNKEIARHLGLSLGTTKNYVAAIMKVLGVTSRVKVVSSVTGRGDADDAEGAP